MYFLSTPIPAISFIGGLAGADITVDHFRRVIDETQRVLEGGEVASEPIWLNEST